MDRLDRLTEAVQIARRARSIAVQSVVLGMGMSIVAMAAAALGFLPVVAGAILQEAIDVVVILNALRALRGGVEVHGCGFPAGPRQAHGSALRTSNSSRPSPGSAPQPTASTGCPEWPRRSRSRRPSGSCRIDLLPHEELEDRTIYPTLANAMGSDDATGSMHRTHQEIFRLARLLDRLVRDLPAEGPSAATGRIFNASCTAWKRSSACIRRRKRICTVDGRQHPGYGTTTSAAAPVRP